LPSTLGARWSIRSSDRTTSTDAWVCIPSPGLHAQALQRVRARSGQLNQLGHAAGYATWATLFCGRGCLPRTDCCVETASHLKALPGCGRHRAAAVSVSLPAARRVRLVASMPTPHVAVVWGAEARRRAQVVLDVVKYLFLSVSGRWSLPGLCGHWSGAVDVAAERCAFVGGSVDSFAFAPFFSCFHHVQRIALRWCLVPLHQRRRPRLQNSCSRAFRVFSHPPRPRRAR
jgi:hypothetical protein